MARKGRKTGPVKKPGNGSGRLKRATTGQVSEVTIHFAQCCSGIQPVMDDKGKPKPIDKLDLRGVGSLDTCSERDGPDGY